MLRLGGCALAAEKPIAPCKALAKLEASLDAKTHAAPLTEGQFHFIEGVYVGSPMTPDGLPPGAGALIITHDGDAGGLIVWTRGALACAPSPVNDKLLNLMQAVKTGQGEDADSL